MPPRFVPPPGHTVRCSSRNPKPVRFDECETFPLPLNGWRHRARVEPKRAPRAQKPEPLPQPAPPPAASPVSSAPTSPRSATDDDPAPLEDALSAFECAVDLVPNPNPGFAGVHKRPRKYAAVHWTAQEDAALLAAVQDAGPQKWSCIALLSGLSRSAKQCRERYCNTLNPNINFAAFTQREDRALAHARVVGHCSWAAIARTLPGRTDSQVKNRFNKLLANNAVPDLVNVRHQEVHASVQSIRRESTERTLQRYLKVVEKQRLKEESKLAAQAERRKAAQPPVRRKPGFLFSATLPHWSERAPNMFRVTNWHVAAPRPSPLERGRKRRRDDSTDAPEATAETACQ